MTFMSNLSMLSIMSMNLRPLRAVFLSEKGVLKFPKHGSRNNIKYGYKKTLIPFETASLKNTYDSHLSSFQNITSMDF